MALNSKQQMFWTNEKRKLSDLKPWERNPRQIKDKQAKLLAESFSDFGQVETIAISANGDIYNGHQRLSVLAGKYGMDYEVDVRVSSRDLTEKERERLTVYLHRGATGEWDFDELANWDMSDLLTWGFEESDFPFDVAPATNEGADAEPQIDKAEELRQKWNVQSGQMWQLGEHRIICGDCTDRAVVERVMGGEKARLEFSDPPYDFETKGGGVLSKSNHMAAIEKAGINKFDPLSIQLLSETSVFCCNKNLVPVYIELANKNNVSWDLCFYKKENTPPNFGGHLMTDTEYLPVIGKQSPNSGMEKELYSKAYIGGLDENHKVAWQKPIGLVEKFVKLFSKQNEIVIDRFLCTGTTLIACENLSRKCRAVEISPAYVAVAIQRWVDVTGKEPILLDAQ
jgi:DNA modification methylase